MASPKASGRADPLLAALIDKLPPAGAGWPRADRVAWLELMAKAFDVVYGREDAIDIPAFLGGRETKLLPAPAKDNIVRLVESPPRAEARFYISADGRALRDPGAVPVKVGDVPGSEVIFDERPLGKRDLDTITWADGSWPAQALPALNFAG